MTSKRIYDSRKTKMDGRSEGKVVSHSTSQTISKVEESTVGKGQTPSIVK